MKNPEVGIVCAGRLGSDIAFMLTENDLCDVVLFDEDHDRARYVAGDLQDTAIGREYTTRVRWSTDLADLYSAEIIVVAEGSGPTDKATSDDTRAELFANNRAIGDKVAESFLGASALFLVATEPIDLMTAYITSRLHLPPQRVLGLGGLLDSLRLRFLIGETLGVNPAYVHAQVAGPHDQDAVILWDFCAVNGISIHDLSTPDQRSTIERRFAEDVTDTAKQGRGETSRYAPAIAAYELLRTLVKAGRNVHSVTMQWGNGLGEAPAAMSVPAVIGQLGAERHFLPKLDTKTSDLIHERARYYKRQLEQGLDS